ncbi:hypothetical protein JW962_01665 [Candidatus Dojkabacteria bacterium]|nr:hypothetical protein [Candidatus Dojkabacteria bacterium]
MTINTQRIKPIFIYVSITIISLTLLGFIIYIFVKGDFWRTNNTTTDENNDSTESQTERDTNNVEPKTGELKSIETECGGTITIPNDLDLTSSHFNGSESSPEKGICFIILSLNDNPEESIIVVIDDTPESDMINCSEELGLSTLECAIQGHSANQVFTFSNFSTTSVGDKIVITSEYQAEIDFYGTPMILDEIVYGYEVEPGLRFIVWGGKNQADLIKEIVTNFN